MMIDGRKNSEEEFGRMRMILEGAKLPGLQ